MACGVAILGVTLPHGDLFAFRPKVAAHHLGIEKICNFFKVQQRESTGVDDTADKADAHGGATR
jgi:hypothetical protein